MSQPEENVALEPGPTPGAEFACHVFAEYPDAAGQVVRTPGATAGETALPPSRQAQ